MPSITDGLFAGRAGIQSHGTAISVLADNIANANTTGFKYSRADFADLLAGSIGGGGGATSTGSGSSIINVTQILNQGTFEFTGRGLDTGIDGNGFFIVEDQTGSGQRFYTRAGNFEVDRDGYLLNQNGYRVLGFPANGAGGLDAINVNQREGGSVGTTAVTIGGNLDADSTAVAAIPVSTDFATLANAASFSTFVDFFDGLGGQHTATVYFFKTAANAWTAQAYVDSGEFVGGTAGNAQLVGTANLTFGVDGSRSNTPVPPAVDFTTTFPAAGFTNGAAGTGINFTFDPMTQFSSSSGITSITQDGTGGGSVVGFSIEEDGTLFARLSNGQSSVIGTIALASFANPERLRRTGSSLFSESTESGEPVVGQPATGTFGSLESGALELSTADIGSDFIKLISLQRGFQGSSRVIQNINDLLQEIINLA